MGQRRRESLFVLCLVALLSLVVCRQTGWQGPVAMDLSRLAQPQPVSVRGENERSTALVTVLGPWQGPALESFWAAVQPYARRKQISVNYESTPDVGHVLAGRIEEGSPPDIAILPSVALLQQYARAGQLVPLRHALDRERLAAHFPPGWLDLVSVDGEVYGLFYRAANQSLVWYSPGEFRQRRWSVPRTWGELVGLSERIAAGGLTPWSVGLKSRVADGQAGTDWIENILLRSSGPEVYDRWVKHQIAWTNPAVVQAFLAWGQIMGRPQRLYGGLAGALAAPPGEATFPLLQEPPGAYLCLADSSAQPLIAQRFPKRVGGSDYDFFTLPALSPGQEAPVVAGADVLVLLRATPEAAALLAYLASAEVQTLWVQRGGFLALSAEVDLASYPDALSRRAAQQLLSSHMLRYDASAQMPPQVERAFCSAVCQFLADPSSLLAILQQVEEVAQAAYPAR